jgi:MFS family permease
MADDASDIANPADAAINVLYNLPLTSGISMTSPSADQPTYPSPAYAWYVVVVLTMAYVVSFLDRQILALLVEPIREDLGLSDTQIGLLMGLAFALFYTILGLPIGRLADRYSRRVIIAAGISVWCLMTAACGLSRNFIQLFVARVGVGIGEATLNPSALSLISDYFPRERRGRAISFFNMGVSVGAGVALIGGSWVITTVMDAPPTALPFVGELQPWQIVFLVVGLPGLLIAILMATVREPERHEKIRMTTADGTLTEELTIRRTIAYIGTRWRLYGSHFLGMSVVTCIGYAYLFWIPTMFIRTWDWSILRIGITYGLVTIICGPAGVSIAGYVADRLYKSGRHDAHIRVCLGSALLFVAGSVLTPLMPTSQLAIAMLIPASLGAAGVTATGVAGLMMVTPNQVRAQTTALYYFVINIIGLTIGASGVGAITDYVFGDPLALRYSLSLVSAVAGLGGIIFLRLNLPHYQKAIQEADTWAD